jgi:esterase/lipase
MTKKKLLIIARILSLLLLTLYLSVSLYFYKIQESLIFVPIPLEKEYKFDFKSKHIEINTETDEKTTINSILFQNQNKKSENLIFYLHGNSQNISTIETEISEYLKLNWDVLTLDYRKYGKSNGEIVSEDELHNDVKVIYDRISKSYKPENIIIVGYSLGTGFASKLASKSKTKHTILIAPHYSISDLINHMCETYPSTLNQIIQLLPLNIILKYKLDTSLDIRKINSPLTIFHGKMDDSIYYGSSIKLSEYFKPSDTLISLENQGHLKIYENIYFKKELNQILK